MTGVPHHFEQPQAALREAFRVLVPRGSIVVIDPWLPLPLRQLINLSLRVRPHERDSRFYPPTEARSLLITAGFLKIVHRRAAWHSFIVRAERCASTVQGAA